MNRGGSLMWTEWFFQAEQGGSRLPDYMAPPVWNIQVFHARDSFQIIVNAITYFININNHIPIIVEVIFI